MGVLRFTHGTMASGKSALALQMNHTLRHAGRNVALWTFGDRLGNAVVSSRLGLQAQARLITTETALSEMLDNNLTDVIVDEAQFAASGQVDALAEWCDTTSGDVHAFGLTTDFTTSLFPGTARFLALADEVVALPVAARCWCGQPARCNVRVSGGKVVRTGPLVLIGDLQSQADVYYEVLCRTHWRLGTPRPGGSGSG